MNVVYKNFLKIDKKLYVPSVENESRDSKGGSIVMNKPFCGKVKFIFYSCLRMMVLGNLKDSTGKSFTNFQFEFSIQTLTLRLGFL